MFSSSSTVYRTPKDLPLREDTPIGEPTSPYGRTKLIIGNLLADICKSDIKFSAICLGYFIYPSGFIGEKLKNFHI